MGEEAGGGGGGGLWDSIAQFISDLGVGGSGNKQEDTPLGEFGARANAVGGTDEGAKAFAEQRRGEIGNPNYTPTAPTTSYYAGLPNTANTGAQKAAEQTDPPKPKGGGKTQLLDIPKVDPGASGVVDPTVPPPTTISKAPSTFRVTPEQSKALSALYGNNTAGMNDHILYKIASGDHSLGPYTPEQLVAYRERGARLSSGEKYPDQQRGTFASILGAAMKG